MENKIKEIIGEHLGLDVVDCGLEMHMSNDLGADSLDGIEILMALEDEYDIILADDSLNNNYTVGSVVDTIRKTIDEQ